GRGSTPRGLPLGPAVVHALACSYGCDACFCCHCAWSRVTTTGRIPRTCPSSRYAVRRVRDRPFGRLARRHARAVPGQAVAVGPVTQFRRRALACDGVMACAAASTECLRRGRGSTPRGLPLGRERLGR